LSEIATEVHTPKTQDECRRRHPETIHHHEQQWPGEHYRNERALKGRLGAQQPL
jgi:hypothetical protein